LRQLPLQVRLPDEATFANFLAHAGVAAAVAALKVELRAGSSGVFLHGPPGSGRTHLLQAGCHLLESAGPVVYLPLAALRDQPPAELLEGLEVTRLLCLDDIDSVLGRAPWEEALFHLYNRALERRTTLLVAAAAPPAALPVALADLRSRLSQLLVLALRSPDEEALRAALMLRAHNRGLELDEDVARFLLRRAPRRMDALLALLERLDTQSLSAGRRLTIPFVRDALGWVDES